MISQTIAKELSVKPAQVEAAIQLLDQGSTVPFIARYRKEATQALDDSQLRQLEARLIYLRELGERKKQVIQTIQEQGLLTEQLQTKINSAENKQRLEDLFLPYKVKRKSKALTATEANLDKLLHQILTTSHKPPLLLAKAYLCKSLGFMTPELCLEGAASILVERCNEEADLMDELRHHYWLSANLSTKKASTDEQRNSTFRDYFNYSEKLKKIPSHRALAIFRGHAEDVLRLSIDSEKPESFFTQKIIQKHRLKPHSPAHTWITSVIEQGWMKRLKPRIKKDLLNRLKEQADNEAVDVFCRNLKSLLLAAPAGSKTTLGLDPGIRTGVKGAIIDPTGKVLDTFTIYPHPPKNQWKEALNTLRTTCERYKVQLISIGNGTGCRETEQLVKEMLPDLASSATTVIVNEAGASVYSASELAAKEFPELDVTLRGAVSIARRLQDPLAELVKIDPKAIGVGQYQHDINKKRLNDGLDAVVEDCVNAVGVDLNSASASLLQRISGLNQTIAGNIVAYRDNHGPFSSRSELKKVPRLGDKAFEQSAAFLRLPCSDNLLDRTSVHPESYALVEKISNQNRCGIAELMGNSERLDSLNLSGYLENAATQYTLKDILAELQKPGRDPRPDFITAQYQDDIQKIDDLYEGLELEGTVTNVANFGAFVDIGVHQDGLIHISQLADRFIKSPHDVVSVGQIVKVRVTEVDVPRKRIGLSMKAKTSQ